jgi:type IV secretion system protein VirB4
MAIDNYPLESWPGIMDAMNHIPLNYRWSNRFIALDQVEAEAILKRYRRNWWQKRQSVFSLIREETKLMGGGGSAFGDSDAVRMAQDADEAVADNSAGIVKFGYHTSAMIFMDENRATLDDALREAKKRVQAMGFNARIETVNAVEAYLGSLPGHGIYNVRRPIVNSANLSDMLPITSIWPGEAYNPNPFYPPNSPPLFYAGTSGHTPFRFNIHVGDLGHTLVLGPTGAGKSTLLGLIAAQFFRYPRAQVFAFDKGYSMMPLALAAGGEHYDIGGDNDETAFCPLGMIDKPAELDWAAEFIETLFTLAKIDIDPRRRQIIYRSLQLLAASPSRTMTDFLGTLKDDAEMREALQTYTIGGSLGRLLDAERDTLRDGSFQVFEMEHLMNRGEKATVPVLQYLFRAIERRLDGRPTLILLDEAWIYLSHDMFREKIREWLKVLRKANAAVVFSTQSVSDIARSPIRDAILESTPVKVYLANPEAQTEISREAYRAFGLTDHQIALVSNMTKKRHYFYVSPIGRRIINLELKPVTLSFIGAAGRDDLKRVLELYNTHGALAWPYHWLNERGLNDWANYYKELTRENI